MSTHDPITGQSQSHDADRLHPARLDPDALAAECDFRRTRRSGPGGRNRNKVETAVILTHRLTGVTAEASERRTQERIAGQPCSDSGSSWPWTSVGRREPTSRLPINRAISGSVAVVAAGS